MLDEEKILARANALYAVGKSEKYGDKFRAVTMQSDSIRCLLKAIVEALNARVQY